MSDYSFLLDKYPEYVTKDQFYRICHISKKTAKYYLDNGFIPCFDSGKKTRRYRIKIVDIVEFLEKKDQNPESYYLPGHFNNPFPHGSIRKKDRNSNHADSFKLKCFSETKNYRRYLKQQLTDYPDMMTIKQIRQVTGHSDKSITSWCKSGKVRFICYHYTYLIQKESLISFLYQRESQCSSSKR